MASIALVAISLLAAIVSGQESGSLSSRSTSESWSNTTDNVGDEGLDFYTSVNSHSTQSYIVGLRQRTIGPNFCLGVLIAPQYVLATRCQTHTLDYHGWIEHNYEGLDDMIYATIASKYGVGSSWGETIQVKTVTRYEGYQRHTGKSLFYLLKLATKSTFEPIELAPADGSLVAESSTSTSLTWPTGTSIPSSLKSIDVTTSSGSVCSFANIPDEVQVCGVTKKPSDICKLNNGSPLVVTKTGKDYLVGLLDINHACDDDAASASAVFNRVDNVAVVRNWISKLIADR